MSARRIRESIVNDDPISRCEKSMVKNLVKAAPEFSATS